jgi:diguanylate cyclase
MSTANSQRPLVVIADDEDLGRLLLCEAAQECGLEPVAFDNGLGALQACLSREVAIVLLDVDMPGLNGFDVCRRLRAESRLANVPIVMVTGNEDQAAVSLAFEAGATDFISKPVNWALLPRRLEYILRNAASAQALSERIVQVRTLVEAIPDTLWVVSPDGRIQWSPNAGRASDPALLAPSALTLAELAPAEQLTGIQAAIRGTASDGTPRTIEYRQTADDASWRSYELRFNRREGGDVVVVRRDTSERTAAAEHIEWLAYMDTLTGLPNRQRCLETAERLFADAAAARESVAVIYMDLNSFKRVNDTFGHSVGDAVLRIVAGYLTTTLDAFGEYRDRMKLSRFGGDEFVILLRHADARSIGLAICNACCSAFKEPIAYEGLEFYSAPSIGVAIYPEHGGDVATVFKHADTAMYHAKGGTAGGAVSVYTHAMSARLRDWLDLEARLRRAVYDGLLQLQFQPKFRLSDNRIAGVEALLRWCDPEHGDISPTRFIEIAEDSGLIIDIGAWVANAACRHLRSWLDRGCAVPIAINVSAKELLYGDPARIVEEAAAAHGVPASLIEIEITESLLLKDSTAVRGALERLRALGCKIALDDFGTGYSSLAYITRFPPDRIKIDKSFVLNVDQSDSDAAIANAILSLGASLNLTITAEGVERPGQLEWLRSRGCHEVQGYLLSRPLSAEMLEQQYLLRPELIVETVRVRGV